MTDFTHLSQLEVTAENKTIYRFYQIEGVPWLEVTPATSANKPYQNALIKKSSRATRAASQSGRMTPQMLDQNRDEDRELYARYIVKSWGDMVDAKKKKVSFSAENVEAFFKALPDWLFDELRLFCAQPQSFLEDGGSEDLAKN